MSMPDFFTILLLSYPASPKSCLHTHVSMSIHAFLHVHACMFMSACLQVCVSMSKSTCLLTILLVPVITHKSQACLRIHVCKSMIAFLHVHVFLVACLHVFVCMGMSTSVCPWLHLCLSTSACPCLHVHVCVSACPCPHLCMSMPACLHAASLHVHVCISACPCLHAHVFMSMSASVSMSKPSTWMTYNQHTTKIPLLLSHLHKHPSFLGSMILDMIDPKIPVFMGFWTLYRYDMGEGVKWHNPGS